MTTPEPTRWLQSADAPLSADERAALGAYAARGPSAAQQARMWAAVNAPAPGLLRAAGRRAWWGAGIVTLSLLAAVWIALPRTEPRAARTPPALVERAAAAPVPGATDDASAPKAPPTAAPRLATDAEIRPAPERARLSASPARLRPRTREAAPSSHAEAGDPSEELLLLTPARQLLATETARALALADEHARRFPRGVFAEERDFLRIEALLRLSRRRAAEAEAQRFRRGHPQSTYLERLNQLLAAPPQP